MRDYIIIHDKLLEYGGAESVLASLVRYRRPKAIICSCVSDRKYWEDKFQAKIITPFLIGFIKNQRLYKLLYPVVILGCFLSPVALPYKNTFFIVYSSSAGKYIRLPNYKNALLYVNYHAKGLRNGESYFNMLARFQILVDLLGGVKNLVLKFENRMAERFLKIYAISIEAAHSLSSLKTLGPALTVQVLHCPAIIVEPSSPLSFGYNILEGKYFVIVSRLYPEKMLENFLNHLYVNANIKIVVIGDGSLREDFIKKYSDKFLFLGFLDAAVKNEIIKNCLAVLQPTPQEWSLVTVESNIMGVPVIAADSGGLREINNTISDHDYFPNLLFNSFDELPLLMSKLESSRSFLIRESVRIKLAFSEATFHQRLGKIEDSIFVSSIG
jgi:glycosyltransferase involved in cell wall biosynthesis